MSPANARSNGDLNLLLEQTEADWATCALKVDTLIKCHQNAHEYID